MKLYKITQSHNTDWYSYDSAIVTANNKAEAKRVQPSPFYFYDEGFYYKYKLQEPSKEKKCPNWASPKHVKAEEIGEVDMPAGEVLCASFNAGFDESRYLDIRRLRAAVNNPNVPKIHRKATAEKLVEIEQQLKDRGLAELRYHFVEANRNHDLQKIQDYEIKIRDYMGEIYEDWS